MASHPSTSTLPDMTNPAHPPTLLNPDEQSTSSSSSRPPRAAAARAAAAAAATAAASAKPAAAPQHVFEEEVTEGVTSNWEVAYVYAFITKFTDIRSTAAHSLLTDVSSLESALVDSSPAPGSKIAKVAPPPRLYGYANQYGSYLARPPPKVSEMEDAGDSSFLAMEGEEDDDEEESTPNTPAVDVTATTTAAEGTPYSAQSTEGEVIPSTLNAETPADGLPMEEAPIVEGEVEEEDPFLTEPIPTSSPLLVQIIKHFESNLYLPEFENSHGRRDWFSWLVRFVNKRLLTFDRGGFEWEYNLLKRVGVKSGSEKEQEFWLLKWEDKIHLLRQMVDYQLMHSTAVRQSIDLYYDLGKQRVSKREPLMNPLIIDKAGKYGRRQVWHLDDSPRLYASGNPFKKDSTWHAINMTADGYAKLIEDLPEPDREQWAQMQASAEAAAAAAAATQQGAGKKGAASGTATPVLQVASPVAPKPKGRGRGKGKVDEMSAEQLLRARLETDWPAVLANEKALEALNTKRTRAADRLNSKDHRAAKNLARADPYGVGHSTGARSTRLRTQSRQTDYVYGGSGAVDSGHEVVESGVSTPRKRARGASEGEGWETEESGGSVSGMSTPASVGGARGTPGGSGRRTTSRLREEVASEWKGERRSSRMALKRGEELEEAGAAAAEAWEAYVDPNALPPLPSLPATATGDETLLPAQPHVAQDAVVPEATGDLKVVDDDLTIPSSNGLVFPPPPPVDPSPPSSSAHLPTSMDIAVADPSSFDTASKPQSSDIGVDSSNADTFAEGVQVELNGAIGAEGGVEAMDVDVAGAEA